MVSFQCDNCCDVVKKPKLDQHRQRCHATFTCIDCSTTFQHMEYKSHTSCISEAEKYQKSLYKKKGNNNNNKQQQQNKVVEQKPKETSTPKPLSLIDELKQKKTQQQQETNVAEPTKRKVEGDKDESKKKQKKSSWEQTELPLDNKAKTVQLALREVLSKANTSVSIKDCRKKVVKLIASHPKAGKKLTKSDIKDVFDDAFLLGIEGETFVVKTA